MSSLLKLLGADAERIAGEVQNEYEREVHSLVLPGLALPVRPVDVVHVAPWLFDDISRKIDDRGRMDIAISSLLYRDYLLGFDAPIDGDTSVDALRLLAAGQWHERALTRLFRVVPAGSAMWGTLAGLAQRQIAAAIDERALQRQARQGIAYSFEAYAALAAAKSAMLIAVPAACCAANGDESRVVMWGEILDPFSIAEQLRDDLTDWRDDWNAGKLTYPHIRALTTGNLLRSFADGNIPDAETVGHFLFHEGIASELLAEAIDAFNISIDAAREIGAKKWVRFTENVRAISESMARKVGERRVLAHATVANSISRQSVRRSVNALVGALATQHERGYPEAVHFLRYGVEPSNVFVRPGVPPADGAHEGAVFSRGIIGWFYAVARRANVTVTDAIIEENLETLAALRIPGEELWSYHPTCAAVPADLDDLAQVLLAFVVDGTKQNLDSLFTMPVELALDMQKANGAIETWMINPLLDDAWKGWYAMNIAENWGEGAEPEVVANFAAALHSWKPDVYRRAIELAANFVIADQSSDGSWLSTWYVGPYYGTFVSTRMLRSVSETVSAATPALAKAREFLLNTQRADGGWGVTDRSDPASTAFAVLGLSASMEAGCDASTRAALERGVRWLLLAQRGDGLWFTTVDFIRYNFHRVKVEFGERFGYFRSSTLTSAYAGAALLSAERWLSHE